jgi:hypothetical protein
MENILFFFACLSVFLSVSVLFNKGIVNIMMPMIGKAACQTAIAGS